MKWKRIDREEAKVLFDLGVAVQHRDFWNYGRPKEVSRWARVEDDRAFTVETLITDEYRVEVE